MWWYREPRSVTRVIRVILWGPGVPTLLPLVPWEVLHYFRFTMVSFLAVFQVDWGSTRLKP